MADPFYPPNTFQLPQLFESLMGTPQGESLDLNEDLFSMDNYYKQSKFWNDFKGVGQGQMNLGETQPTQFKDNTFSIGNDFSDTYYL